MATIFTKYSVGDVVYFASTEQTTKRMPCPDCKGTKSWQAISPAGRGYIFACPRCNASYQSERDLSLDYAAIAPTVRRLTIGSIQVNTRPHSEEDGPVAYMCVETGVGSGSVYYERQMFATEAEALTVATLLAAEQEKTTGWIVKLYNKRLELCDYQLPDARGRAVQIQADERRWKLDDLLTDLRDAESIEDVKERIETWETA